MTESWPPGSQQAIGQTGEFLEVDPYRLPLESLAAEISRRLA